jgi:hypothetical protein
MRYINTPDHVVEQLKKQARKQQRAGGGKYTDLLNLVAKQAGYANAQAVAQIRSIREQCEAIIAAEMHGEVKVITTQDGKACPPFVLFSTGIGDAWLLEPNEYLAMCLVWQGEQQTNGLSDDPDRIQVAWDGMYELLGDFFNVESNHPVIGSRAIAGYPISEIRRLLNQAQSNLMKMASVIGQFDAIEITAEVIAQMVKKGMTEEDVLALKAQGYRYSPGRDSLLGPIISSEDDEV